MFDVLIKGGMVIDGSGSVPARWDIGIKGERIEAVGALEQAEGGQVIDATGLVVAPGFIDIHSHADFTLPVLPTADSKIHQGVTTELVGNCGYSLAPLNEVMRSKGEELSPLGSFGAHWDWDSFAEFTDLLRRQGTSVNVAPLVGHGIIRMKSMGMSDAAPTPAQMKSMQADVRQAMKEGAFGFSTGLGYSPNVYAKTDEIIELAKMAAEQGGIYTSHIRDEGFTLLESIDEAIEVGRKAHMPVEISHLKASLRSNWYKMSLAIQKIDAARAEGLDVSADMYPYNAFCTTMLSLIPSWAQVGGIADLIKRFRSEKERSQIRQALERDAEAGNPGHWEGILISYCASRPDYEGRSLRDLATERGLSPEETVMNILEETNCEVSRVQFAMDEGNVEMGLKKDFVMIGSDGEGRSAEGPLSVGKPHPRNYGTFVRVLGHYARERGIFPLEVAVHKMTGMPAAKLALKDRGLLKSGYFADVTVFDPTRVIDKATFTQPHQYAEGIEYVFVNGRMVIEKGRHNGALPGKVLSR
jgi:N-acyl-D-amino-acid deacylase